MTRKRKEKFVRTTPQISRHALNGDFARQKLIKNFWVSHRSVLLDFSPNKLIESNSTEWMTQVLHMNPRIWARGCIWPAMNISHEGVNDYQAISTSFQIQILSAVLKRSIFKHKIRASTASRRIVYAVIQFNRHTLFSELADTAHRAFH